MPFYVSRWACSTDTLEASRFVPSTWLQQRLVTAVPLQWLQVLPRLIVRVLGAVLLPHITATEIDDGNVNFSFRVNGRKSQSIFLKQATAYLKWQPQMALEADRMRREVQYYRDASECLGADAAAKFLPRLIHFDPASAVMLLDFLTDHSLLLSQLFETGEVSSTAAAGLGEYLGRVHAQTLERDTEPDAAVQLAGLRTLLPAAPGP